MAAAADSQAVCVRADGRSLWRTARHRTAAKVLGLVSSARRAGGFFCYACVCTWEDWLMDLWSQVVEKDDSGEEER